MKTLITVSSDNKRSCILCFLNFLITCFTSIFKYNNCIKNLDNNYAKKAKSCGNKVGHTN